MADVRIPQTDSSSPVDTSLLVMLLDPTQAIPISQRLSDVLAQAPSPTLSTLLSTLNLTQTELDDLLTGASISGNVVTFSQNDGTDISITLPVVTGGSVSGTTLTLNRASGAALTINGLPQGLTVEQMQDGVDNLLRVTSALTKVYDDSAGTLTLGVANEFTAADETKLDGIETGATADQTAAEIRTLLGITASDLDDMVVNASISGSVITLTQQDGSNIELTVPSGGGGGTVTREQVDDWVNALLLVENSLTKVYSDSGNTLTLGVANPFTAENETKLDNIEDNATADQTASEIRTLLGVTEANLNDMVVGASVASGVLTLNQKDGSTLQLTLPTGGGSGTGLNQTQVLALIDDWAEHNNTSRIPSSKLPENVVYEGELANPELGAWDYTQVLNASHTLVADSFQALTGGAIPTDVTHLRYAFTDDTNTYYRFGTVSSLNGKSSSSSGDTPTTGNAEQFVINGVTFSVGRDSSNNFHYAASVGRPIGIQIDRVLGSLGTTIPLIEGTAAAGTSPQGARADHVHPTGGGGGSATFTGLSDTPSAIGSDGQILQVNTAGDALEFVDAPTVPEPSDANPAVDGTAAQGSSTRYSRQDHVHPEGISDADIQDVAGALIAAATQTGMTAAYNTGNNSLTLTVPSELPTLGTAGQVLKVNSAGVM